MPKSNSALSAEELRRSCNPKDFKFKSTAELPELGRVVGQERAMRAVEFGIEIESPGYHIFALGPAGTGKRTTIGHSLERIAAEQSVPDDWCYVNNFDDEDQPDAMRLPAGMGRAFRGDMDGLVEELKTEVPEAFETEEYEQEREQIQSEFQQKRKWLFEDLQSKAEAEDFTLLQTPAGIVIAPVVEGEVLRPEQFNQLDESRRKQLEASRTTLEDDMRETVRRVQSLQQEAKERVQRLDRQVVGFAVSHLINQLKEKYERLHEVTAFLEKVQADILDNVQELKQFSQEEEEGGLPFPLLQRRRQPSFDQYRANLIVDNSELQGAPVVQETNPTFQNLIGRVEHQASFGALVTNYTMIKGGSLHHANGGYLMIAARDLLTKPFAWEGLKRALMNREVKIERMGEAHQAITTRSLEPEPIPLDVKVILTGESRLYYLLHALDEDFQELFKAQADFAVQMDWSDETVDMYARFIASICNKEDLRHFDRSGVARVVEQGARMVSDQGKLATKFGEVVDLIRQANYWAGKNGRDLVSAADVEQAVAERIFRSNRVEQRLQEMIEAGTILIDTEGRVEGQVNGLSVAMLGDYAFGKPSRITARTHVGKEGVVAIDREAELGGPIHTKGVMILAGYLGGKFAHDLPFTLSASITFEQLYGGVEGDSASSAELYALLSSLSGLPLRQDLAVTGSVNQRGQVQAIGGVNEKIEGFFDVCRLKGLSGGQGVLIPRSNVRHLMLHEDVVAAVREGKFHIYPVDTIDQGIELLTGVEAGERREDGEYPQGTVNAAVQSRLRELAEKVRDFGEERASAE